MYTEETKQKYIANAKEWIKNNPEKRKIIYQKYEKSEKGKLCVKRYCQTFKGYLFRKWWSIKQRCNNSNNPAYKYYGGRGIKCLFKSVNDFRNYVINDLGITSIKQIKKLDIDRIDNDGHYKPGNIQFITHKENCKNRKRKK